MENVKHVAAIVRREKVVKQTALGQHPPNPISAPEDKAWEEGSQAPPVSGVNSGKLNKFSAKSPLVTTMGSSQRK